MKFLAEKLVEEFIKQKKISCLGDSQQRLAVDIAEFVLNRVKLNHEKSSN